MDKIIPFLQKHKSVIIACTIFLALTLVLAVGMRLSQKPGPQPATTTSEVDFDNPEATFHTADEGSALIAAPRGETPATTAHISHPDEIWVKDTAHTYNNFTLPEAAQMDDESIGILTIQDIGLSVRVYESADQMEDMQKGVAHFKSTSAWDGTIGLSAHNVNLDGSAGYFLNLHKLQSGAEIQYTTALGTRDYVVESVKEIAQADWSGLGRSEDNRIVLITCITGKPTMRLMVTAKEKIG